MEESLEKARHERDQAIEKMSFLEELINGSDDIIQVIGYDGALKFVSKSIEKYSGFSVEQVKGIDLRRLYPPDELARISRCAEQIRSKGPGESDILIHRVLDKAGQVHLLESGIVNRPEPPINGFISVSRDITSRGSSILGLKDTDEALRTLFNVVEEGILIHNRSGEILHLNKRVMDILDITPVEVDADLRAQNIYFPEGPERNDALHIFDQVLSGDDRSFELVIKRWSDNRPIQAEIFLTRMVRREEYQILATLRDITSRKANEQLSQTLARLSTDLSGTDNLSDAMNICVDSMLALRDVDAAGIYLLNNDGDLELKLAKGVSERFKERVGMIPHDSSIMNIVKKCQPQFPDGVYPEEQAEAIVNEGLKCAYVSRIFKDGELFGTLNVGAKKSDHFPLATRNALEAIAGQIGAALSRIRVQEALRESEHELKVSLKEKETLLKEIHHRIKNNLSTVAGLLRLQSRRAGSEEVRELFDQSAIRVTAMGLVHEKLYLSRSLSTINSSTYFESLVREITEAYGRVGGGVRVKTDLESFHMGVDIAAPLGMIVTELVSNSLKHAFPKGLTGEVIISVKRDHNERIILKVTDNGVGLPEVDPDSSSLGGRLVEIFAKQIEAQVISESNGGATITVILSNA
jgi:PAS domain S-box-containing protein